MATWPATLPVPSRNGYGLEPIDPVARTSNLDGRRRSRERHQTMTARVPVSWVFTEAQLAVFEAWFSLVALDGAAWFNIALADGHGIVTVAACFADVWRFKAAAGGTYTVSATFFVRALPFA